MCQFYTCDVFTTTPYGGNPLAVVLGAEDLTGEQMQLIAREFNYSETTFVLPAEQGQTNRVRIFNTTTEMPFAGHPNIGTAFTLASIGALGDITDKTQITFEEKAGLVPISIQRTDDNSFWCELQAPEPLSIGQRVAPEKIAETLSLELADIVTDTHPPQVASVGLPFVITEVRGLDALERIRVNPLLLNDIKDMGIRPSLFVYTKSQDGFDIRARMFAPLSGTVEDPATGSANCALVGMLTHYHAASDGEFSWHIAQGVEMGRTSILDARTQKVAGEVAKVWIAGRCVKISEGRIVAPK